MSHSFAGNFSSDFNSGTAPAGTAVYGNAVVEATGGVDNSGVLKLTKAVGGQSSSFILDDLDGGTAIYGFEANFKARVDGGGTPADGFSLNFAPDLPQAGFGETGAGTGLTVVFDIYINNPPETSRTIQVKIGGQVVASQNMTLEQITTGTNFADVHIRLNPNGALDLTYQGQTIFTNFFVPNYQALQGQFGFGARTGGAFANQFIDNLSITTFLQPQVGIRQQPHPLTALQGSDAVLSVDVSNSDGATFQWFKNGTAVTTATNATLTLSNVAVADSGSKYKVTITGANNNVTSDEVTLTVRDVPLPSVPTFVYDFNDGAPPANTTITGTAQILSTGGVNNSGSLQLTIDVAGVAGAFLTVDPSAGAPIYGITAQFDVLVRSAATPADGFSFNFASDIPDDPTAAPPKGLEEGTGTGLTVAFDIYDNGGGEAPAIDVIYNNKTIASAKVPIVTGDQYANAIVRLGNDGRIDVVYKGVVVHDHVFVPGFTSITGGRIAFAGRTGGSSADQWLDNIKITPDTTLGPLRIATDPSAQAVLAGKSATFTSAANDSTGVTFQWLKNGTPINGATSASYTTPATVVADNGALFKLQATKGATVVTSAEARLTVVDLAVPTAPTASFNFEDGQVPAGTHVYGSGTGLDGLPWVAKVNAGVLQLTELSNGEAGALVIDPLLGGGEISAITVAFDVLIGGSSNPADGMSFNYASDLSDAASGAAEEGVGTGLSINFDIYDNSPEPTTPRSIDVKYKGVYVASTNLPIAELETGDAFRTVLLRVTPDGKLDLAYGDRVLFAGVQLSNYTFTASGKFGFYARTGGLNENQWVDNIKLQVTKSAAPLRVTQEPADALLLPGQTATFTVTLSDPAGATYEWSKNGTVIGGATSATYTTPALALTDAGAKYRVRATGPGGTVTSREAIANVVAPLTISNPTVSYDFESGQVPDGASLNIGGGTSPSIIASPGTNGMVLQLTDASGGQNGSLVIPDLNAGQPVSALTVHFENHVANGSGTPADGFAFVWADDLPLTAAFGEGGAGSGLVVAFDTYQNAGEQAPAIQVTYKGTVLVRKVVPYSFVATGEGFVDSYIRVESDGTLDLQYGTNAVFANLQLPGFTPMVAGSFGFGARTGGEFEEHWVDNIQIATGTGGTAPQLSITKSAAGAITISWTGGGTLQARDDLNTGTAWAPVNGATSPYSVTNDRKTRFFRIAQ